MSIKDQIDHRNNTRPQGKGHVRAANGQLFDQLTVLNSGGLQRQNYGFLYPTKIKKSFKAFKNSNRKLDLSGLL